MTQQNTMPPETLDERLDQMLAPILPARARGEVSNAAWKLFRGVLWLALRDLDRAIAERDRLRGEPRTAVPGPEARHG